MRCLLGSVGGGRVRRWRQLFEQLIPLAAALLDGSAQLGQLRAGKLREVSAKLSVEMAGLACEALGALEQALGLAQGLLALLELLLQAQEGTGIFEQSLTTLRTRRLPARVQRLDFAGGELLLHDLLGQSLAGFRSASGQRHQGFHRRLHGDLSLADRLLNRRRKLAHQTQTSRYPARALDEALGQLFLAPAEAMLELDQQPPLLESRRARAIGHLPLQDQRLGFLHLPHQGLDRVTAQTA
jgi:hypothetical protein